MAVRGWLAALAALTLASCQAMPTDEVLDAGGGPVKAQETVGSGPVHIAMLLPRSGEGAQNAVDFRNGAVMALDDLAAGKIMLTIYDTQGSEPKVKALALKAIESGARAIVGPAAGDRIGAVTGIAAEKRPPVITLAANSADTAQGVFAFAADEIDSALAGVRAAAEGKGLVVLVPEDTPEAAERRLRQGAAKAGARLAALLRYGKSEPQFRALLLKHLEAVSRADAVLILGDDNRAATLARLAGAALEKEGAVVIGTSAWPREAYADPAAAGVILALVDQTSLGIISGRYRERFGRPLSLEAAFAYDAVGALCGIVRAHGADGLTARALLSPTGFRGATGIFRFTKDGHVQRRFALYRIEKNGPREVRPMPVGF